MPNEVAALILAALEQHAPVHREGKGWGGPGSAAAYVRHRPQDGSHGTGDKPNKGVQTSVKPCSRIGQTVDNGRLNAAQIAQILSK